MISKFKDIVTTIIPFFLQYPIHGVKALDFKDFCHVAEMMKDKKHLTKDPPPVHPIIFLKKNNMGCTGGGVGIFYEGSQL